jgi:predicted nucleic acid-binding protein
LAQRFEPLAIDEKITEGWSLLVSRIRVADRRIPINDSWIAATAIAHNVPLVTQDSECASMPDVEVIVI